MSTVISGNATWYCLCYGGSCRSGTPFGACGDCHDAYLDMAWPYVSDTGCNDNCGQNCLVGCGYILTAQDQCTAVLKQLRVADCCPCASQEGCNKTPFCGGNPVYRPDFVQPLADLTVGAFLAMHGSLNDGRFEVQFVCN